MCSWRHRSGDGGIPSGCRVWGSQEVEDRGLRGVLGAGRVRLRLRWWGSVVVAGQGTGAAGVVGGAGFPDLPGVGAVEGGYGVRGVGDVADGCVGFGCGPLGVGGVGVGALVVVAGCAVSAGSVLARACAVEGGGCCVGLAHRGRPRVLAHPACLRVGHGPSGLVPLAGAHRVAPSWFSWVFQSRTVA